MDDTVDTDGTPSRNTKIRAWFGTWNSYPDDWRDIITRSCDKYVAQPEVGASGNPHIQFAVYFKNARSFNSVKKLFQGAHLEPAKNWGACKNYCKKSETKAGEGIDSENRIICRDPLQEKELYEWQREICDIINSDADDRTIFWYWEPDGCQGKTTLAKHLCLMDSGILYMTGKAADIKYGVFQYVEEHKKGPRCVIIDLTRSTEGFVSWQGIEEVKNGIFYNTKYECKMVMFDNPHVIIFANYKPEKDKLSSDRWKLKRIK